MFARKTIAVNSFVNSKFLTTQSVNNSFWFQVVLRQGGVPLLPAEVQEAPTSSPPCRPLPLTSPLIEATTRGTGNMMRGTETETIVRKREKNMMIGSMTRMKIHMISAMIIEWERKRYTYTVLQKIQTTCEYYIWLFHSLFHLLYKLNFTSSVCGVLPVYLSIHFKLVYFCWIIWNHLWGCTVNRR